MRFFYLITIILIPEISLSSLREKGIKISRRKIKIEMQRSELLRKKKDLDFIIADLNLELDYLNHSGIFSSMTKEHAAFVYNNLV